MSEIISSRVYDDNNKLPFIEGAILTGSQIQKEVEAGNITIDPFIPNNLNPNSYNITLDDQLATYMISIEDNSIIDIRNPPKTIIRTISKKYGFVLFPNLIYLGISKETIGSDKYVPILTGRSSFGRLGISSHQTGNFGDIGFNGKMTMQIRSTYATKIYPDIKIAQVYFLRPYGSIDFLYNGKYQDLYNIKDAATKIGLEII